jgi:hypothetical protein
MNVHGRPVSSLCVPSMSMSIDAGVPAGSFLIVGFARHCARAAIAYGAALAREELLPLDPDTG